MAGEVFWSDDGMAIGWLGAAFVTVLRRPMELRHTKEMRRAAVRFNELVTISSSLTVLELGAFRNVSDEVRREIADIMKLYPTLGTATVVEGTGFKAATGRTIMAGIYLLSRPPYPQKIFDSVGDGARFAAQLLTDGKQPPVDPAALVRTVEMARARLAPAR